MNKLSVFKLFRPLIKFDMNVGMWSSYVDRLEMYFTVNEVKDSFKLPTLIEVMGVSV